MLGSLPASYFELGLILLEREGRRKVAEVSQAVEVVLRCGALSKSNPLLDL